MELADAIVRKTLEVIRYFDPPMWWLETPRNGRLPKRRVVEGLPYVDVDYCRFEDCGYLKSTRFFGSEHLLGLESQFCDGQNCPGLLRNKTLRTGVKFRHRWHKGGGTGHVVREVAYHIPRGVIEYVTGLAPSPPPWDPEDAAPWETPEMTEARRALGDPEFIRALTEVQQWNIPEGDTRRRVRFEVEDDSEEEDEDTEDNKEPRTQALKEEEAWEVARRIMRARRRSRVQSVKTGPQMLQMASSDLAETLRQALYEEFKDSSLSGIYPRNPPKRGPDGEAEIWLKPDARPVSIPPYRMQGEKQQALAELVSQAQASGKMEPGKGP